MEIGMEWERKRGRQRYKDVGDNICTDKTFTLFRVNANKSVRNK